MKAKQVIVIRKDLKMRRGKEIAQGAHAAMAWLTDKVRLTFNTGANFEMTEWEQIWLAGPFTKVVVQVNSEIHIRQLYQRARELGIPAYLITDAGLTEFQGQPTITALSVGPDDAGLIDEVTGELELY